MDTPTTDDVASREQVTLSTGQTVSLPLSTTATMTSVVVPAALDGVRPLLPTELSPIRIGPTTATVAFLSVEYHSVDGGTIEPYNEFGVLVPAFRDASNSGFRGRLPSGIGGYVWYLPVTTEPARALGEEIWGYPKVTGEIEITDTGGYRHTTVSVDGEHLLTIEIDRPSSLPVEPSVRAESYTVQDGTVLREPLSFSGQFGIWPLSTRLSHTLGTHPRADVLRELSLGNRALVRCHGTGTFEIHPGTPIDGKRESSRSR
ncbi:acetoacetate decarboxylase family protein [Halocatena salina]|uniref:Acetoacetate decarboxylase family protein n=1 Tax=Halocatena salina TaxID=2934340 RepID=A0A8U0A7W3_9EURY|nr:acetoacetate decarboxylase family protein [Halocatena salina]UPM44007.1 acetoacetate decarboxylase family protein [Halocatena salina]